MHRDQIIEMINKLHDEGYAVVIWTPEEMEGCDINKLEEVMIERGDNFIEDYKDDNQ